MRHLPRCKYALVISLSYAHTFTQTLSRDASFGTIRSCHPPLEAPRLLHGAIWAEMTGPGQAQSYGRRTETKHEQGAFMAVRKRGST